MNMLTLAALEYTYLYFSRALSDCSQVCFQLNTLFLPFSFLWMSPALLSPTLQFFEKELLGFWQRPTQSLTQPKGRLKDLKFSPLKICHSFLPTTSLYQLLFFSPTLLLSIILFYLLSFLNKSVIPFFFTVVIVFSSLYPFFLLFILILNESMRSYWIFDRGLLQSLTQPGERESTSLSSLPHPLLYFQYYHVHFHSLLLLL